MVEKNILSELGHLQKYAYKQLQLLKDYNREEK